jgi:hypothetical protein
MNGGKDIGGEMGWIGIDLDGTLAEYDGEVDHIGKPIPKMAGRVREWLWEGRDVRIFTARVAASGAMIPESGMLDSAEFASDQAKLIKAWCKEHVGVELLITCIKDAQMEELWDDRAVQVIKNTGQTITEGIFEQDRIRARVRRIALINMLMVALCLGSIIGIMLGYYFQAWFSFLF